MSATMKDTTQSGPTARELAERINQLATERGGLYRNAVTGWSTELRDRLKAIDGELALLWEQRRRARAGQDDDVAVRHAA